MAAFTGPRKRLPTVVRLAAGVMMAGLRPPGTSELRKRTVTCQTGGDPISLNLITEPKMADEELGVKYASLMRQPITSLDDHIGLVRL